MNVRATAESDALERYLLLEKALHATRDQHSGAESEEEDEILDDMDQLWWVLSPEQRRLIDEMPLTPWHD